MHAAAKAADEAVASSGSVLWALAAGRATSRPQEQQAKDVHDHHDHSHHMAIVLALVQNLGLLAVGKDDIDEDAVKDVIERDDLVGKPVDCNGFAAAPLTAKSIENGAETLAETALLVVEDPGEDALAALEKVYDARSSLAADKAAGMVYYTLPNGGVLDVAGGKGDLAFKLLIHAGVPTTIVDPRPMDVPNMLRHVTRALVHRLAQQIDEDAKDARPLVVLPFPKHIRTWFWYPLSKSMGAAPESYVNDPLQPVPVEASGLEAALQSCSAIVGMHSDQATEAIVDWGLELGKPFAVVPCCVFPNLFPERGNVRKHPEFLRYLVHKDPLRVCREKLSFAGRNDVVFGHRKNEAESTTLPGDTIDSDKSSGSDAFKDSDMPNGEDGDNGKHGDDGNMGDDAKDTEDAECCDEDDQHRSKSSNGCVPSDVDSDQTQFRSTSEVVILPWSPLAMHLQDTGEDDGAVYGSLAQELVLANARGTTRFASNVRFLRVTEEDLLRVARLLRNEMHSLWASSEATIQVEDINQVPQQIRSPKDTEALRMIRANLENLRQGLAGVEAVLWACEEDLIDDCRDTSRVHSLVDELGATWQQFQPDGAKAVQGAMRLAQTLASKRGLSAPAAQGLHWTTDAYGTGVRVNDDKDDDFGSQSSNEPATVEVDDVERAAALSQPFTDVYQGFVEEPRPRRRGPAPLDDPASLEAREAAKVASNMLGELGSVLSHHRSGLAPERVVRTEGKAPSARDTKNAKRRDRVQMETSHDAVPATEAHAVVGELARLLAAMPQRLDDDTQFS
ncbi:Hypothetical Protein FCC1311_037012 [Hondaea fermentalgiana]|uniref:Uncharacterized protein n=1 Tax=Hondaea fermentalgiana TaxID=2315210 RepID=A0A2R5GAY2_9STRA|nr:Hypothetical Protein FCC1311_037012 [Hondaea fermentalgiana]|eukprot:GBG27479.1 Hypothetical Protein FCC1311_037012 [Hondaea fermentalgiana]